MSKKGLIIAGLYQLKKKIEKRNEFRKKVILNPKPQISENSLEVTKNKYSEMARKIRIIDNLIEKYKEKTFSEIEKDFLEIPK